MSRGGNTNPIRGYPTRLNRVDNPTRSGAGRLRALSNGRYKSCLHRAVVNRYKERRSLAFFLCPKEDKILRPPQDIVGIDGTKHYPDFTWSDLLLFTQNHYRADESTLHNFTSWFLSSKTNN
ncbi:hypothetical protein PIB30_094733 [Stylosanthes scabra]|uniref:Isopenicillin N synthase-like Fe(2+) 2OG dioxygenase domain-containing protein n=1 Tax=Stylosanthes scabra TaxID=79078 RepID=A0ABU6QWV8_9FABA|nr:hypothetical protein [Stylosanthes scabra]